MCADAAFACRGGCRKVLHNTDQGVVVSNVGGYQSTHGAFAGCCAPAGSVRAELAPPRARVCARGIVHPANDGPWRRANLIAARFF